MRLRRRGESSGRLRSSSFSSWVIVCLGYGLKVDNIRGDCRAGRAVFPCPICVGGRGDVVAAKGAGGSMSLEVAGFSVFSGAAAYNAGS